LCVCNGDAIEGTGAKSGGLELLTADRHEQSAWAARCLREVGAKNYHMTYGTGYHVGDAELYEGLIAQELGCKIGWHEWPEVEGVVFDVRHFVGSSAIPWGRHTAVSRERIHNLLWHLHDEGQPRARFFGRSHVHYHADCGGPGWRAMTLPALQHAATRYGAARCSGVVDVGLVVVDVSKGEWTWHAELLERPAMRAHTSRY
jgi:hypothetical protein